MLYNASQDITRDSTWSLLADIEEHNQSMQEHNTSGLSKLIADVTGLKELANLPKIFSSLSCFFIDEYKDQVTVIDNQFGGIEGWLNPFWTIVTCCLFDSMRDNSPLELLDILVYSDDVNATVSVSEVNYERFSKFFYYVKDHARDMGFILKISQTILSKHRIAILRRHYTAGKKADSSIKKLLVVSSMSESAFMNEATEASSICPSINSALEQTNDPISALLLKHFHLINLTYRSVASQILTPPESSWIVKLRFNENPRRLATKIRRRRGSLTYLV